MMSRTSRTCRILVPLILVAALWMGASAREAGAAEAAPEGARTRARQPAPRPNTVLPWAIALSVGLSSIAAGYAVGRVGAAALGAASENPELLTRSLLFVALAEGIAIYGLLIAILMWFKL